MCARVEAILAGLKDDLNSVVSRRTDMWHTPFAHVCLNTHPWESQMPTCNQNKNTHGSNVEKR